MQSKKLKDHINTLKKDVFFTDKKWPHFNLLFEDIKKLSNTKKFKKVLSLERGSLYGNISLFAPLFFKKDFTSIDCSTKKILSRGSYNKKFVTNKKIIKVPLSFQSDYRDIKIRNNSVDLIIIPNLMHHIYDHKKLIKKCKKILRKNGKLYIFEPTLREIHQYPEDFFRFTPFSLKIILKEIGFKKVNYSFCGGPFTAAAYCLDQALQYLPKNKRNNFKKRYMGNIKNFLNFDSKYKKNLVRKNTIFPMSFSITASV